MVKNIVGLILVVVVFIAAIGFVGCSKQDPVQVYTYDSTAVNHLPLQPTDPYPPDSSSKITVSPNLSWVCSDPDAGNTLTYIVYFDTIASPTQEVATNQSANNLNRSGLQYNKTYYWKVVAKDNGGAASQSPVWKFTTMLTPNQAPNTPSAPTGTTVGYRNISYNFTATGTDPDTDSLQYRINWGDGNISSWSNKVTSGTAQTLSHTYMVLSDTTNKKSSAKSSVSKYGFKLNTGDEKTGAFIVRAQTRDEHGDTSSWSNSSIIEIQNRAPNAPTIVSPSNGAINQQSPVTLNWACTDPDGSLDILKYDVYLGTEYPLSILPVSSNQNNVSLSVGPLVNNKTYYWQIVAKDNNNGITTGPIWNFTTADLPPIPVLVYPYNGAIDIPVCVTFCWDTCFTASTYTLQVSTNSTFTNYVYNQSGITSASQVVSGLNNSATYYWRVRSTNSYGTSAWASVYSFTTAPLPWATKASMPTARAGVTASVVNNKVYAIGGFNGSYPGTGQVNQVYEPATDTWENTINIPTGRGYLAAAVVNNRIYAIGGYNGISYLGTVEVYDPATAVWSTMSSMLTARASLAAAVVNNKIYAIGGVDGAFSYLATVEEYDPATDTWTTKTSMPTERSALAVAVVNNKIYAIGGYDGNFFGLATVQEYDPATDIWTNKTSMPTARYGLTGAVVGNKIYAIGGRSSTGGSNLAAIQGYDPATDVWTNKTSMPTARYNLTAAVVDNKIYAIGGYNGSYLATVEVYNPFIDP